MVRIDNCAMVCHSSDGEVEYGSLYSRLGRRILYPFCRQMALRYIRMVR
jgi:hypothetical protein